MSAEYIMLREGHKTLYIKHIMRGCFIIDIQDGDEFKHIGLDRSQAHLLMLYLQQYLTVGKRDYSDELDKVIETEMNNKPKDIMK